MNISQRTFALMLAMTPGMGGRSVTRVLARNELLGREPAEFLRLAPETLREEYRLSAKACTALGYRSAELCEQAESLERRLSGLGVALVTAADAHYPRLVEEMDPQAPGLLFLHGNARLLESRTFSVMSSRDSQRADLEQIERLAEGGVLEGEVLVAGHDTPEYQRAAVVPLRWGSPRILCLDRGLFRVLGEDLREEAFRAARLWRYEFDPHTDLVVSPFRPEAEFIGVNNQVRDRLIACLSLRIDFVQVSEGGNMERLARLALGAGRVVRVSDRCPIYRRLAEAGAEVLVEAAS
jgi:predicted Rossmann fold nucleotide-binding protein DprA/Smf involved in DNA uptake